MATKKKAKQKAKSAEPAKKTITQVPEPDQKAAAKKNKAVKEEKGEKTSREKAKKAAAKKKKPSIFKRFADYVKGVISELKKVSWLSGEELTKSTAVVAGCVAVLTILVWLVDTGLGAMAALLLGT